MNANLADDLPREGKIGLNKANDWSTRIKFIIVAGLTCFVTGCAGYVDGGYGGGYGDYGDYGDYDGGGSDLYFFGGGWDRGRDSQYYSHRGATSRGWAHSGGGGYGGGHAGGGHGGGGLGGGHGGGGHGGGGGRH